MSHWHRQLKGRHQEIQQQHRWRARRELTHTKTTQIQFADSAQLVNFSSNDYLGLSAHEALKQASIEATVRWGSGSGASHLVCGHQTLHHQLEDALADFVGAERALLFSTGYMANLAIPSAFLGRGDWILQDKLNHASLIDGGRLSRAKLHRYPHADMARLQQYLQAAGEANAMISTDGIFSMDGDSAPIQELSQLAVDRDALLLVDDAHGLGVMGEEGKGVLEMHGLSPTDNTLLLGTLGKAMGSFGAFVAGDAVFIEHLIQTARPYIYTTALPPAVAAATLAALGVIKEQGDQLRTQLFDNIVQFKQGVAQLGYPLMPSESAIQPLVVGSDAVALRLSQHLMDSGFYVTAIRPPTVPEGSARLRFAFSAAHTSKQIESLLACLAQPQIKDLIPEL